MGLFAPKPAPERWDTRWLAEMLIGLRKAVNELSETNFPSPLKGDTLVKEKSLSLTRIAAGELMVGTLVALAAPHTTTSTTLVSIGPLLFIDTALWTDYTRLDLVVTAGPSTTGGNTVVELHDNDGAMASITITTPGQGRYKTTFTRLPGSDRVVYIKIQTTNASVSAGILGAHITYRLGL